MVPATSTTKPGPTTKNVKPVNPVQPPSSNSSPNTFLLATRAGPPENAKGLLIFPGAWRQPEIFHPTCLQLPALLDELNATLAA